MFDGRIFFDSPVKIYKRTYDSNWKIANGYGDDHAAGCLVDYYYKMIAIHLSKQQELNADLKAK